MAAFLVQISALKARARTGREESIEVSAVGIVMRAQGVQAQFGFANSVLIRHRGGSRRSEQEFARDGYGRDGCRGRDCLP
jgi:hypothetical protein